MDNPFLNFKKHESKILTSAEQKLDANTLIYLATGQTANIPFNEISVNKARPNLMQACVTSEESLKVKS